MSTSPHPHQPGDPHRPRQQAEVDAAGGGPGAEADGSGAPQERSPRKQTRVVLVVVVLVLALLSAEIAYFISADRQPPRQPPAAADLPGWQQVRDSDSHASYWVPPQFLVEDSLQRRSLGRHSSGGSLPLALRSTATLGHTSCEQDPDAVRALAGFVDAPAGERLRPPEQVARDAATRSLTHRDGTVPTLPDPTTRDLALADGGTARVATLRAPVTEAYPCSPPELQFTVVEFELRGRPTQFLLAADAGTTQHLDPDVQSRILQSLGAGD